MCSTQSPTSCPRLTDSFSMAEKALMCGLFYGFPCVGVYAISLIDPAWAWGYLVFTIVGFSGVVMGSICARCPYPYTRNTCLFFPKKLVPAVYKSRRSPMRLWEKVLLVIFFTSLLLIPLPWLIGQPVLLAVFYGMGIPANAILLTYYCKRCRNTSCLFNRAVVPAD